MFAELSVRHRWRLSNSEGDESSAPGLHKRFTKRLSHFWRRKRDRFDAKVAAKTKQAGDTPSNNANDDRKSIGQRVPYKALSLLFKSGYPVPAILARARLQCQQNVIDTEMISSPYAQWPSGGFSPSLAHRPVPVVGSCPSEARLLHKRPPGSPGKSGSNSKKPRKENKQPADKAQNGANGDGAEGGGDESPSGTDSDNDEDDEGDSSRDGPRYPLPTSSPDRKRILACPFHKHHPARYCKCKGLRITSISYVIQHIGRGHVLKEVRMDVQETAPSTDDSPTRPEKTTSPDKIVYYCPTCRDEFHGRGADIRWERHTDRGCETKSIADTGVLLLAEFEKLKKEVTAASGSDKWDKIWQTLYPGIPTPSPYNEAEPVAPLTVDALPHNDIQHDPLPVAVNEPYHPPPQDFGQQRANFPQNPQNHLSNDPFSDMFNASWGTTDQFGDVSHATSHISNPALPDSQMIRPMPDLTQWMPPTQSPSFTNNNWNNFIICRVCGNAGHMAHDCPDRHHNNFDNPQ
ncbi:ankyrin 3 [Fusarium pseudoanthophilum]|uniref:Ankyrin 3 n=1 Tax=Fusarium pseudoanthophilum TaxID=48495 RepID=A0A8H5KJ61_9HYPO|nr:ankyrin 3 [Fusarium pseudoanthophilum]